MNAARNLKMSVIIGGSVSGSLKDALNFTNTSLKRVGTTIAEVDRRQRTLGQSINVFGRMGKNVDGLRQEYAGLATQAQRLRTVYASLERIEARRAANLANRERLGGALMGSVGTVAAASLAMAQPIANAANFQRENQLIGNTANMTRQQVMALSQAILSESRITNQSADNLQKAVGFLVAAGMDGAQAQASIRTIGRTATASGADIEDLSRAAFTLQDSLKIDPAGLQDALDMLAVAGKEGNVELKDLAKVLPVLGAGFTSLKMSGREAAATMGAALEIARKGTDSADKAAVNFDNFLSKIMSPTTINKAKQAFGVDIVALIKKAQDGGKNAFEAAMKAVIEATNGDQAKIAALFQDQEVQKFIRPMIQNWDEYLRIKDKALNQSTRTTDRDFAKMMDTDSEKMKGAKIAADNLSKAMGAALSPAVGDASLKLGSLMDRMTAFVQANPKLIASTTKAVVGVVAMRTAVLGLRFAWTFVRGPIIAAQKLMTTFRAGTMLAEMGKFGPVAVRIGSLFRIAGTAIAAIGGGPIAVAVAAITGAALIVRKYWQPIAAVLGGVWDGITKAAGPALAGLAQAMQPLRPAWDAVTSAVKTAWSWITNLLQPVQSSSAELSNAARAGAMVGTVLAQSFSVGIRIIGNAVRAAIWFATTMHDAAEFIVTSMASAWDRIKAPAGAALEWIMGKLRPLLAGLQFVANGAETGFSWIKNKIMAGQSAVVPGAAGAAGLPGVPAPDARQADGRPKKPAPVGSLGYARGKPAPILHSPAARMASTDSVPTFLRAQAVPATVNQTNNFSIQQQPGESVEALARRVASHIRLQDEVSRRSSLVDA